MRGFIVAIALAAAGHAAAGTLQEALQPYTGKSVTVAMGGTSVWPAKLLEVDTDHFCAKVEITDFPQVRCYPWSALVFYTLPHGDHSLWIAVNEQQG